MVNPVTRQAQVEQSTPVAPYDLPGKNVIKLYTFRRCCLPNQRPTEMDCNLSNEMEKCDDEGVQNSHCVWKPQSYGVGLRVEEDEIGTPCSIRFQTKQPDSR